MDIVPHKSNLVELVKQAYEGKLCLPNFQRAFVWRRGEIADLLRSIIKQYFIGSLLLLRCEPHNPPFAPEFLRGAQPIYAQPKPENLVLDGQQRLTALLYALTSPDLPLKDSAQRRWFFLDLDLLLKDPDDDEIIFDRSEKELDGLDVQENQYAQRILPCTLLLSSADFTKWLFGFDDWLDTHDRAHKQLYRDTWRNEWTTIVHNFQSFQVPLVELPRVEESDPNAIGRVCAIFEKLNSTGVELSVYDLLTARLYRSGIRLHDLWDQTCKDHKNLREWSNGKADTNKFGVLILRTLALLRGLDAKPSSLIKLEPDNFEKDWKHAAAAMEHALILVTHIGPDGFGVFDRKWLPSFSLLPVLAALRSVIDDQKLKDNTRSDVRRWYWSNVFLERYSSAVESKSRKDFTELTNYWNGSTTEPTVFTEARIRIGSEGYNVREATSYQGAVYSGVFCLLAIRNARDWIRKEEILLQSLHDHHIFPQSYLKKHGITRNNEVNSIVNRTLISDETNLKIKDKAPADYVSDSHIFPGGASNQLLQPHFFTSPAIDAMKAASDTLDRRDTVKIYQSFLSAREEAIIQEIRQVCGVTIRGRRPERIS